jgi:hypothetical protein
VDGVPEALTRVDVLLAAGIMYGVEFVTDKVPYLDSAWDTISTAIRPTVGAIIGVLLAGGAGTSLDRRCTEWSVAGPRSSPTWSRRACGWQLTAHPSR